MQHWTMAASYAYCQRLACQSAGNFYPAFQLLPTAQRRGMCALYAFLRVADDLSDAPGGAADKRPALAGWREAFHAAINGDYYHPVYPALHDTIIRFGIPIQHLEEVLDGVTMDLDVNTYDTFADLYRYCYHVASAVGLCCIHIWGFEGDAYPPAESAGIALQLTNILRDIGEDVARDRVYLPRQDLDRFGCTTEALRAGLCDPAFKALMRFEADRAYGYYDQARALAPLLHPPGRAVFLVLVRTYRELLDTIVKRDYDVFTARVRLPTWRKLWLVARALPVRFGLLAGQ
jgi:phytoene synthase